jgi:dihydroxyacetone kinase phosphotransfer subunit
LTRPPVGLVIVSHSRPLARAAIELAAQMLPGGPVAIEEAAGLEDGSLGTDAVRVAEAIARADGGRGVVVLADLGSAVLAAELAVELLDPALRERVTLSPGPLVEGLCVAAVAAAGGAGRDGVAREAATALAAKQEHMGGASARQGTRDAGGGELPAASGRFEVTWPEGLHARPAAVLVRAVRGLEADVRLANLTRGGEPVPATSLARVLALGAGQGEVLEVTASGRQAGEAVGRILDLALRGFGDLDERAGNGPGS